MSESKRIALIGFGNMGQALVRGWLANGRDRETIRVVDAAEPARERAHALGLRATAALGADGDRAADVVVLAVKPQQLDGVLVGLEPPASRAVFLSIAAGKTLVQIGARLPTGASIVRAMPNTPATIGRGMSVLVANRAATPAERALCGELLAAVGETAWVDDERDIDAVTAISGSGPAYVFLLIECLERSAVDLGLSADLAKRLAVATVAGAGAYAASAGEPPAELRRRVTSPGGTTQAALEILGGEHGLGELLGRAVRAAAQRSRDLSTA